VKQRIEQVQDFYLLFFEALRGGLRRPLYIIDIVDQMAYAGSGSFVIVFLVMLFVGMALSLQISAEFAMLGMGMYTGQVVGIAIVSEIGPVVVALVFAGRSGSGMASELGTMMLQNQVDTLRVFGIDPIKKLVTPRIAAAALMVPALTIIGDFVSLLGGAYIAVFVSHQSHTVYWNAVRVIFVNRYVLPGLIKPFLFGLVIASMSCYMGLTTRGGAVGLKNATTQAFVASSVFIIVIDFVVTRIILLLLGFGS
jgi:phospholipid/cholesterol/gamma-HCH transport system permease protein